jgi:hypothetical protein
LNKDQRAKDQCMGQSKRDADPSQNDMKQRAGEEARDDGGPNRESQDRPSISLERCERDPRASCIKHEAEHAVEQDLAEVQVVDEVLHPPQIMNDPRCSEGHEAERHDERQEHEPDARLQSKVARVQRAEECGQDEENRNGEVYRLNATEPLSM